MYQVVVLPPSDALGSVETFGYDAAGNMTARTDKTGETTTWTYDGNGRVAFRIPRPA